MLTKKEHSTPTNTPTPTQYDYQQSLTLYYTLQLRSFPLLITAPAFGCEPVIQSSIFSLFSPHFPLFQNEVKKLKNG